MFRVEKIKFFLKLFFIFILISAWIFSGWPQIGSFLPKIEKAQAAAKTLYFRSTASTTVSGNTAVDQLLETAGSSNNIGTTIKHGKNINTWQFIPDTAGNTTTYSIPSTPNSNGWIWDGASPGGFANAQWTINVDVKDTSATGTAVIKAQVWKVTATTTAVTQVTNLSGILSSASFTPSTSESRKTLTFTPAAFSLDTNEYIYAEVYLQMTAAGGSSTGAMTKILDSSSGTLQGNIVTSNFTATVAPTVSTQAASSVEATTATGNGNISSNGGGTITEKGVCYMTGTSGDPTTANGTFHDHVDSTGAFTESMTGLSSGTSYRVRAYAINSAGTGYGTTVQMLTKPADPANVQASDGTFDDKVRITWDKSTGATDYHVWRDSTDLGSVGDVATFDDSGADAPSITAGSSVATDGDYTDKVALSLSGTLFNDGAHHTYKVVASNATGNSAGNATNTGYRGILNPTYQWQRTDTDDSGGSYSNLNGATNSTYNDSSAPADGSHRWYQCLLNTTGLGQQISAYNSGYRAPIISASVSPADTDYGMMVVNQVKKADTANANDEFVVTNNGTAAEDFDIISSNATGGSGWTLSPTSTGVTTFMYAYSTLKTLASSFSLGSDETTGWVALDKGSNYKPLASNVAVSDTAEFILELLTPTDMNGDYNGKQITVIIRATPH